MTKTNRNTCWWCGGELIWQCDYDKAGVYGDDSLDGIITHLLCKDCGALVTYETPEEEEDV